MSQTSPSPAPGEEAAKAWEPPDGDQEFVFESIDAAPDWVDRSWASFSMGPALAVPAGNLDGTGPYHTKFARVGDKVLFVAAKGATPAHLEVVHEEPDPSVEGMTTKKIPQVSNASLEDALRTGAMTPDDLSEEAKAQVIGRTPGLRGMIEEGKGAPAEQAVSDLVKLD